MKIVFASNFFNHHQKPLSDALCFAEGVDYHFIAFSPVPDERKKMGYQTDAVPPYVCNAYENDQTRQLSERLIAQADVVIAGSAPEAVIQSCLARNQLVLRYSERPLKKGFQIWKYIPRYVKWHRRNPKNKRIYMLCASAYTAGDYRKFGLFKNRAYKWGYFPDAERYDDPDMMITQKDTQQILWCGRFLDWKHPDDAIEIARRLRDDGYSFRMNLIGRGEMDAQLRQMVARYRLEECVTFLGTMKPEQVRTTMEQTGVYLFTSDRQEGWGAVLNEAMNSGCAVVTNREIGSVPYLVKDDENGLIYSAGDLDALYRKVKFLLENPDEQRRLGKNAYQTVAEQWNAETAAKRLLQLTRCLLDGDESLGLFEDGPCSKA